MYSGRKNMVHPSDGKLHVTYITMIASNVKHFFLNSHFMNDFVKSVQFVYILF